MMRKTEEFGLSKEWKNSEHITYDKLVENGLIRIIIDENKMELSGEFIILQEVTLM